MVNNYYNFNKLKESELLSLIRSNKRDQLEKIKNRDYYRGKHDILNREPSNKEDPNIKVVTNFIREIVDRKVNITLGSDIKVFMNCEEDKEKSIEKMVKNILATNNFEWMKIKVLRDVLLYGDSFIYIYQNEKGNTMFEYIPSYEGIIVYKDRAETIVDFFVRYYKRRSLDREYEETVVEVIDDEAIYYYITNESGELIKDMGRGTSDGYKTYHIFDRAPVVHFKGFHDTIGSINDLIPLNDRYNSIMSYIASVQEKESRTKLILRDIQIPKSNAGPLQDNNHELEWIEAMKNSNVFLLKGSGDVNYLQIPMVVSAEEQIKILKAVEDNIYRIANLPNTKEENNLGNSASGVSIKARNQNMEIEARRNKNIVLNGLLVLLDILKPVIQLKLDKTYNISEFDIDFDIIVPMNETETIKSIIEQYKSGIISLETAIEKNPTIDDALEELKRIEEAEKGKEDGYIELLSKRHSKVNNHGR